MLAKNFPFATALWKIPFRICLDALAAWKALFSGDTGYFAMIVKAHVHFIKWLFVDRDQSVFPISKKGKVAGWYDGSVIWQHFIKKKNSFSKIVEDK